MFFGSGQFDLCFLLNADLDPVSYEIISFLEAQAKKGCVHFATIY
jgi:hypothetical protein